MGVPIAFVVVIAVWTTTPIGIAISNESLHFSAAVMLRMAGGLTLATCVLIILRQGLELRKAWKSYLAGGLAVFGGMLLTYWSSQYIPSGLVAVLFGLAPVASAILASVVLKEAVSTLQRAGLCLSVIGLVLVFGEQLSVSDDGYKGVCGMIVAAILFPLSNVLVKRIDAPVGPMQQTVGTLLISFIGYFTVWALVDGQIPHAVSNRSIAAVAYLAVFGSVIAFSAYFYLVPRVTAGQIAIVPVVTPVLGVIVGTVFNNESLGSRSLLGMGFIVVAVAFAEMGRRKAKRQLSTVPA